MKPRTKLQIDVMARSRELENITDKMTSWAKAAVMEKVGLATKNRVICMECGQRFSTREVSRSKAVCPHCGEKLKIKKSLNRKTTQRTYIGYAQIVGEYQVVRYWEIFSRHHDGEKSQYYGIEILQHWITPTGKCETVARLHTANSYCDSWSGSPMEIRKDYNSYYYGSGPEKYDVYTEAWHPRSVIRKNYKKIGVNRHLAGMSFLQAVRKLPESPKLETLLKARQYWLLDYYYNRHNGYIGSEYWTPIKICLRNEYRVKDAGMWHDYIDLLMYFKMDTHNAHYVCPKNLNKEHDILVKRKQKILDRKRMENEYIRLLRFFGEDVDEKSVVFPKNLKVKYDVLVKREKIEKLAREKEKNDLMQKEYAQRIAQYMGIDISDKTIRIVTLGSIEEFEAEGRALNHCVYTNSYFKRKDSLILSARIDNKPIETIEVSLSKMKIVQARGLQNQPSKYHDRIVALVNKNMPKIKKVVTQSQNIVV